MKKNVIFSHDLLSIIVTASKDLGPGTNVDFWYSGPP